LIVKIALIQLTSFGCKHSTTSNKYLAAHITSAKIKKEILKMSDILL